MNDMKNGYTLIELIIVFAMVIIMVALVGGIISLAKIISHNRIKQVAEKIWNGPTNSTFSEANDTPNVVTVTNTVIQYIEVEK